METPNMNETTVRDLLHQAMAGAEPPPGPHISGGGVRAARWPRRRHWAAGICAAAAILPGLALGVPAAVGALSPAAPGGHVRIVPAAGGAHRAHPARKAIARGRRARTPSADAIVVQRPAGLVSTPGSKPGARTSPSVWQLLLHQAPGRTAEDP